MYLDGFAEVAWVCVVLKGICPHQHHIQSHTTAPHISTVAVVSSALQHLHTHYKGTEQEWHTTKQVGYPQACRAQGSSHGTRKATCSMHGYLAWLHHRHALGSYRPNSVPSSAAAATSTRSHLRCDVSWCAHSGFGLTVQHRLAVAKVTDLDAGCWAAVQQGVFKLQVSVTHTLRSSKHQVGG